MSDISHEQLLRLQEFGSTLCFDALRVLGIYRVYMEGPSPLWPGARVAGVAVTLRMLPERPDLNKQVGALRERSAEYVAMEKCGELSVLVVDAMGLKHESIGGEIKFLRLKQRRARGIITDGGIRDATALREYGLTVFAAGQTAKAGPLTFQPVLESTPVQCGGVLVNPGDVIVGDEAGVVVVPSSVVSEVLTICAGRAELEEYIKSQLIAKPGSPGRFYPITADVQREFEEWKQNNQSKAGR